MLARFGVHFDGPITTNHQVTIRVLAKTYEHMQRSIDRAFLIEKHGEVWKHARLKEAEYKETEFLAEYPREGGIILDAVRDGAGAIIDRIAVAVRPVFEGATKQALQQHDSFEAQLIDRQRYASGMKEEIPTFKEIAASPPSHWATGYSNRSVIKEIDQLVAQIIPDRVDGSTVTITLHGNQSHLPLAFDSGIARRFHHLAADRTLGPVMQVPAVIRSLDRGNRHTHPSAKILNLATSREVSLHLPKRTDCDILHPYHNGQQVNLFVCPILEAFGFDLKGGDLMFLAIS